MGYKSEEFAKGKLDIDKLKRTTLWPQLRIPESLPDWYIREIFCEYRKLKKVNDTLSDYFNAPPFHHIACFIEDLFPAFAALKSDKEDKRERLEELILSDKPDEDVLVELIPGWRPEEDE